MTRHAWLLSSVVLLSSNVTVVASAAKLTVLHAFAGRDGAAPVSGVIADVKGDLYGETEYGGAVCEVAGRPQDIGCGTIYRIDPAGKFTRLFKFGGAASGAYGIGGLTRQGDTLYGTTQQGGASDDGVVFSIKTDGSQFTVLHQFAGGDGSFPGAALLVDHSGTIYGTTTRGGPENSGVLFKLLPDGTYSVLNYSGFSPHDIIFDGPGAIIIASGGDNGVQFDCGAVGRYVISTDQFTPFYGFPTNEKLGCEPRLGGFDKSKNLYGIVEFGARAGKGGSVPKGAIFELSKVAHKYSYEILWPFTGAHDGATPHAGPAILSDGTLLGSTTVGGGTQKSGTFYKFAGGSLMTVVGFGSNITSPGGFYPEDKPIVVGGDIVGTTTAGGECTVKQTSELLCGAVVEITP